MSLLVFAGASQFTAVGMFAAAAGPAAIAVTTLIINARHLLLSASLAPYLRRLGLWGRLGLAAQLTDESYAMGVRQFLSGRGSAAFQIGANLSVYVAWQCSTLAGVLLGRALPDPAAYGLDLVFPLTFIGLLVPLLSRRDSQAVAAAAAALTLAGALWRRRGGRAMSTWLTILGMALVTLLVRALPLLTMRGELPAWLGRWLGYVPVAVFTALALRPITVSAGPAPQLVAGAPLLAGLVGALVAWRTGNTLATIAAGMAAYWALRLGGVP